MDSREQQVIERQRRLIERSAELRVAIAYEARPLAAPLALGDRIAAVARGARDWAAANPLALVAAGVALAAVRPKRAWRWLRRGWSVWRFVRLARAMAAAASR